MKKKNRRNFLKKLFHGALVGMVFGIAVVCDKSPTKTSKQKPEPEEPPKPVTKGDYNYSPYPYNQFLADVQAMSVQDAKDFIIRIVTRVFECKYIPKSIKKMILKAICDAWGTCAGFPFACPNCDPA